MAIDGILYHPMIFRRGAVLLLHLELGQFKDPEGHLSGVVRPLM
jgi:hypothetical protein